MKKILFIGPWRFREDVGYKNIKIIYPSFFNALEGCEFHILHGNPPLPDFTNELTHKFGVVFHKVLIKKDEEWIRRGIEIVNNFKIDVLTNVFFGYHFGYFAAKVAKSCNKKSVVRFPANEIYTRKCSGTYDGNQGKKQYEIDCQKEIQAIELADKVIAISPWEEERLKKLATDPNKVKWCIRGIDTSQYCPDNSIQKNTAFKFLYAGRKAIEKGYKLVEDVASELKFDYPYIKFYFAGQFDESQIDNRIYLGYLTPKKLKEIYSQVDALILPSKSEGFANVIVESFSMGLACIIAREYHHTYFTHKENALLIELNTESLRENILLLHKDRELFSKLRRNSRKIAIDEFDESKWKLVYKKIMLEHEESTNFSKSQPVTNKLNLPVQAPTKSQLRIAFISPRPFGQMGTPGTYLLVDSYSIFSDVCVISNSDYDEYTEIVYPKPSKAMLHQVSFSSNTCLDSILQIVNNFKPNIIIVGSHPKWTTYIGFLKQKYPYAKFVLDIKSPLLTNENRKRWLTIRDNGNEHVSYLDLIMTRTYEDINTWVPNYSGKPDNLIYPLGIRKKDYYPKVIQNDKVFCKKFIYIGQIHKLRKLEVLIDYLVDLPEQIRNNSKFDFYGSGPDVKKFEQLISNKKLNYFINYKGIVKSDKIPKLITEYDAGIAWVPHNIYEFSPSLKLLEYIAAGLIPIAMDTVAHKRYGKKGFKIQFFSENSRSFISLIEKLFTHGVKISERNRNLNLVHKHDWDFIAYNTILPAFNNLHKTKQQFDSDLLEKSAIPINDKNIIRESIEYSKYSGDLNWCPPTGRFKNKSHRLKQLNIAAIVSKRLYNSLVGEYNLSILTPVNWEYSLRYLKYDFLLVESTWVTFSEDWYMAESIRGEEQNELLKILKAANNLSIPTVFWFTKDSTHHSYYLEFAKNFDFIFCADPNEIALLRNDNIKSYLLLPAIQPYIYNPVIEYKYARENYSSGVLFEGIHDVINSKTINRIVSRIMSPQLNIYQRNYKLSRKFISNIDSNLLKYVKGAVSELYFPNIIKYSNLFLTISFGFHSKVEQFLKTLEATACKIPIFHYGPLSDDDIMNDFVTLFNDENDFIESTLKNIDKVSVSDNYVDQAWRNTFLKHTFSNRISEICEKIGFSIDKSEFPKITLLLHLMNLNAVDYLFEKFYCQTYPNKELLIFCSNSNDNVGRFNSNLNNHDNITIIDVPNDISIGSILNYTIKTRKSPHFIKINDTSLCDSNFILDYYLTNKSIRSDIILNLKGHFNFEGKIDCNKTIIDKSKNLSNIVNEIDSTSLRNNYEYFFNSEINNGIKFSDLSYNDIDCKFFKEISKYSDEEEYVFRI